MTESAKEVLTTAIKKEVSIEKAIDIFSEEVKKAVSEREFWRDAELRRAQTVITRQKQEIDLAVKELVKCRKIIASVKDSVGEK